jgi:hypothetical protein
VPAKCGARRASSSRLTHEWTGSRRSGAPTRPLGRTTSRTPCAGCVVPSRCGHDPSTHRGPRRTCAWPTDGIRSPVRPPSSRSCHRRPVSVERPSETSGTLGSRGSRAPAYDDTAGTRPETALLWWSRLGHRVAPAPPPGGKPRASARPRDLPQLLSAAPPPKPSAAERMCSPARRAGEPCTTRNRYARRVRCNVLFGVSLLL